MDLDVNTEDRSLWYEIAQEWELAFCNQVAPLYGIDAAINPEKEVDPTVTDLIVYDNDGIVRLAELKPVFTPFYLSEKLYGIDPQYAFSFNVDDRYFIPKDGVVIFWVNFCESEEYGQHIEEMQSVWYSWGHAFAEFLDSGHIPVHEYERRKNKNINAKESYIFDIRLMMELEKKGE